MSTKGKHSKPRRKTNNKFLAFFVNLYVGFMSLSLTKRIISLALAVVFLVVVCLITPLGIDVVHQLHCADDSHLALTGAGAEDHAKLDLSHNESASNECQFSE